ncbi:MAG: GrpB family protein [Thermomicrobiales bacterium]
MSEDRNRALEPTTVEEMERAHIGKPTVHNAQVTLMDYDPDWPKQFDAIATRVRAALGDRAVVLEHAGSTSVPGLCAKPIIDIVLAVPDSADEPAYVPDLEAAGFPLHLRETDWFEHRLFKHADPNVNMHVFTVGCSEIDRMLLMRDWMRAHPEDRDLYATAKRDLAARTWEYVQHYADAKTTVVSEIVARAEAAREMPQVETRG